MATNFGSMFSDFGGAANDLFSGVGSFLGDQAKAAGDAAEAGEYGLAAAMSGKNAAYTKESTAIKTAAIQRNFEQTEGASIAAIRGSGFQNTGDALDILRSNVQQGSVAKAAAQQQGLITEEGYEEQQQSYLTMQNAANAAAHSEGILGDLGLAGGVVGGVLKGIAGLALI